MDKPTAMAKDGWQVFRSVQYVNTVDAIDPADAIEYVKNKMMGNAMITIGLEMVKQDVTEYVVWVRKFDTVPHLLTAHEKIELVIEVMKPIVWYNLKERGKI